MIRVALCLLLWPVAAWSQTLPKVCDPDDAKSCVQPLLEGEAAPFAGQLLTTRRAAKLAILASGCQERVDLEMGRERELGMVALNGEKALRVSAVDSAKLQRDLLLTRMGELERSLTPPWYERPAFVAVVTVAATVAVLAASVQTVRVLQPPR
jgi:hypothetical protein